MKSVVVGTLTAALLVGLAGSAGANEIIKAKPGNRFVPQKTFVAEGEKVIWKNVDNVDHTVTAVGGGWHKDVMLSPGERTKKVFKKSGTYRYKCTIHDGMKGRVVVEP